jgi:hypothetical protein
MHVLNEDVLCLFSGGTGSLSLSSSAIMAAKLAAVMTGIPTSFFYNLFVD